MFGHNTFDSILKAVRNGDELVIPTSEFAAEKVGGSKVCRASVWDALKIAKRKFRQQNPIMPNTADYVNWILYDRISHAAGVTIPQLFKLFVAPIGSGTKTKCDTNLEQVSSLPSPQWFNCTQLGITFNPGVAPKDLDSFLSTEYLEFWVGGKVYAEGPLDAFPSGGGPFKQTAINTVAAATEYSTSTVNGWPSVHNLYDLRLPQGLGLGNDAAGNPVIADGIFGIVIGQTETFNMQFKADGGGASLLAGVGVAPILGVGITIGARLHGVLSRGVR